MSKNMRFIGLTGGVGAGKSQLLEYMKEHYRCEIYLADEVAHMVKRKGTDCYISLVKLLGKGVLDEAGEIDSRKMADLIFADGMLLGEVNAIIHPKVREYIVERLEAARQNPEIDLFIVEAALLIETGYGSLVDEMWYVHTDDSIRKERLTASRGYSNEKIMRIMENQLSEEEFRKNCDFVIDNSGTLEESYRQIDQKLEAFSWQK